MRSPLVRYVLSAVERFGVPVEDLVDAWRRTYGVPASREPRSDDFADLFRVLATLRDDPDLGLHVAEHLQMRAFSPVVYLAMSSASLSTSIGATIRFADLLEGRASRMSTVAAAEGQVIAWRNLSPTQEDRHHHEFVALAIVKAMAWLRGDPVPLASVRFQHPVPASLAEHERLFGCRPTFGATDGSAVVVPTAVWQGGTVHADATTARLQEGVLEQALSEQRDAAVARRVREAVRSRLEQGATLHEVARALAMSERSLQRKLAAEGLSYRDLVDDVRKHEVLLLLRSTSRSLDAVASATGLSDARSLQRAFARWMGVTPQAWRATQHTQAASDGQAPQTPSE